ncbi:hypothetical protein JTE90_005852 [Oedothorax gibbosus]|uniref:Uncharacterized protein n=1 Tax=Oedothorax gibbosus TaxID=931172 RepID=A0AAV6UQ80_9ARAC|nr:hypothetical protein JTE90_005852 [Oedothorax gibbosus]
MVSHALVTLACILLAVVFFSTPLIIKYHIYRPQTKTLIAGDVAKLHGRLSSVWCRGVDLYSDSNFKAFVYETEPEVDETVSEKTVSKHRIVLPNKAQEYWGFHLLKGSQVEMSACARLMAAEVNVVKSHAGLKKCLLEHREKFHEDEVSGEDSLSQSESDEDTSSISSSQGVVLNETNPCKCSNSLKHSPIPTSYLCTDHFDLKVREHVLYQNVTANDHYYFIFSSDTPLDILPNEFNVLFNIDRTHYNYSSSMGNCSESNHCHLPIKIGSEPRIVVQMEGTNGTLEDLKLVMACKPREGLFLIFYSFFLLFFKLSHHRNFRLQTSSNFVLNLIK